MKIHKGKRRYSMQYRNILGLPSHPSIRAKKLRIQLMEKVTKQKRPSAIVSWSRKIDFQWKVSIIVSLISRNDDTRENNGKKDIEDKRRNNDEGAVNSILYARSMGSRK